MIREYRETDCAELAELFYHTVHTVNAKDYTEEQLAAWATGKVDLEKWNQTFQEHHTVVAVENKVIVGFGDIEINVAISIACMFIRITNKRHCHGYL